MKEQNDLRERMEHILACESPTIRRAVVHASQTTIKGRMETATANDEDETILSPETIHFGHHQQDLDSSYTEDFLRQSDITTRMDDSFRGEYSLQEEDPDELHSIAIKGICEVEQQDASLTCEKQSIHASGFMTNGSDSATTLIGIVQSVRKEKNVRISQGSQVNHTSTYQALNEHAAIPNVKHGDLPNCRGNPLLVPEIVHDILVYLKEVNCLYPCLFVNRVWKLQATKIIWKHIKFDSSHEFRRFSALFTPKVQRSTISSQLSDVRDGVMRRYSILRHEGVLPLIYTLRTDACLLREMMNKRIHGDQSDSVIVGGPSLYSTTGVSSVQRALVQMAEEYDDLSYGLYDTTDMYDASLDHNSDPLCTTERQILGDAMLASSTPLSMRRMFLQERLRFHMISAKEKELRGVRFRDLHKAGRFALAGGVIEVDENCFKASNVEAARNVGGNMGDHGSDCANNLLMSCVRNPIWGSSSAPSNSRQKPPSKTMTNTVINAAKYCASQAPQIFRDILYTPSANPMHSLEEYSLFMTDLICHDLPTITDDLLIPVLRAAINLQRLELYNCNQITDASLLVAAENASSQLTHLRIPGLTAVTDVSLNAFAVHAHKIRVLDLRSCTGVSESGIVNLIKSLAVSSFTQPVPTPKQEHYIRTTPRVRGDSPPDSLHSRPINISSLRYLNIGRPPNSPRAISDRTLKAIAAFAPQLTHLGLSGAHISDTVFVDAFATSNLKLSLEKLIISNTPLTSAAIHPLVNIMQTALPPPAPTMLKKSCSPLPRRPRYFHFIEAINMKNFDVKQLLYCSTYVNWTAKQLLLYRTG
ncbi:hypothetical protein BJ742DRAFT_770966 [Cladochytrium replicatum]|nr:hypothetical protein BJ742DRAFT_770966 [Cladochytrium replicatum]